MKHDEDIEKLVGRRSDAIDGPSHAIEVRHSQILFFQILQLSEGCLENLSSLEKNLQKNELLLLSCTEFRISSSIWGAHVPTSCTAGSPTPATRTSSCRASGVRSDRSTSVAPKSLECPTESSTDALDAPEHDDDASW